MTAEKHDKKACLAHDCEYFHQMLARMDEAITDSYKMQAAYESKIQDLAKETLRNSELRKTLEKIAAGVDHPEGIQAQPAFYEAVTWAQDIAARALSGEQANG